MPADANVNDSICTLREAIISVNALIPNNGCASGDLNYNTIHLPAGTYTLTSNMIGLYSSMTIVGSGASRTIIDANGMDCFSLNRTASVTFQDLTISNCGETAITVYSGESVDIENVSFQSNRSRGNSSSDLRVFGSAWVSGSTFVTRYSSFAGMIRQEPSSSVGIENTTISGSKEEHGIIFNNGGSLFIYNSTIGNNTVANGGIIHLNDANSSLWMGFSTIAYNSSPSARAINNSYGGSATITSSVIMGNLSGGSPTCTGPITNGGYNVFDSQAPCTTPIPMKDTLISFPPFEETSLPMPHGGLGPVYMPLAGSPVLNRVTDGSCYNDQRGAGRSNSGCAAGSADLFNVVVMVGNPSAITAGDYTVISLLNSIFGSSHVSVVNDYWAGSPAGQVIVVTGSVNDAHVGTRLRNRSEGIVILKQSLFDEMNMTASSSSSNEGTTSLTSLYLDGRIPSRSGYTSGGYSSGNNPALTGSAKSYGWGNRSSSTPDVEIMGSVSGTPNHMGLFRYWPGASLYNGDVAENFRIGLFLTDSAAADVTGASASLLQQAVLSASAVEE